MVEDEGLYASRSLNRGIIKGLLIRAQEKVPKKLYLETDPDLARRV